ncbi:17914_t:CDS:2 [Dentiscutata erythropus]|uniref:17914_t:CDS:1 n=1 Tax=Dentiscutata erythropus TaxID=1348616 RepID=A0A9N8ZUR8_9GLOM|nr:17914_t:CDS:2 [Dentiscutata erythropus]
MEQNYYDASVEGKKLSFYENCENCYLPKPNDFCTFCEKEEILIRLNKQSQQQMQFCEKCNSLFSSNYCISCNNKLYEDKDFKEIENEEKSKQATSSQNEGIFDFVIQKYSYTPLQVGYVNNNKIFWSDNELSMDDSTEVEYNFAISNYSYTCTIEEKLHNALAILNIIQGLGISVDETRESINTQLKVQANLKKNYKEIINKYEIERRDFSIVIPLTDEKKTWIKIFEEGRIAIDDSKLLKIWKYTCPSREEYIANPCDRIEAFYKISNYWRGHEFELVIRKILNSSSILANELREMRMDFKEYIKTIENNTPQLELVDFYAETFEIDEIKCRNVFIKKIIINSSRYKPY